MSTCCKQKRIVLKITPLLVAALEDYRYNYYYKTPTRVVIFSAIA
jgi:hypothetical protein